MNTINPSNLYRDFINKYPNDTNIKLRVGSGRVIVESDQHKIEY